jgi:O-antigen ligase
VNFAPSQVNTVSRTAPPFAARPIRAPHPLATGIVLVYLFLVVSRTMELVATVLGMNPRLTMILMLVSLVLAVVTGGLLTAARTPIVLMFTAFTGWFLLATLSSEWRGGSVTTLTTFWIPSYACVLLIPSLISTLDQCRAVCYVYALSLGPMLLATVLFQAQVQGRDGVNFGTLGNPNDLAFSLLLLIPFAVFVIQSEKLLSWKTIACALAILFALLKTLKTGSRSGLTTMATCLAVMLLWGSMKTKLKIVGLVALMLAIAAATVPSQTLQRYATLFSGTSVEADMSEDQASAVESTQARKMLFQESVRLMFEHPLLGVGPGIFTAALAVEQKARGQYQSWHVAHNSYTQIGSEMGIPGFLLYIGALLYSMKRAASIYRRTRKDPAQIASCRMAASLSMALVIYAVCATFGNYSFTYQFPILAGLVQAFDVCVRKEMNTTPSIIPARSPARPVASTPNPQVPTYVRNRRLRHDRA